MFGNQNANAGSSNNCLTYANVGPGSACIALVAQFVAEPNSLVFGPLPTDATISHLHAVTDNSAANQTVMVVDNVTATPLTCTTTAGSTEGCSDDTDSVSIPAGDFLQVRVVNGAGSWRVTFQLG
jgi:hypothetical protein